MSATMNEKLMLIHTYDGIIWTEEVEIIKETEKQFKLKNSLRNLLNKSEIGKHIEFVGIFCYQGEVNKLAKEYVEKSIERIKSDIENKTNLLNNYEKSLEKLE